METTLMLCKVYGDKNYRLQQAQASFLCKYHLLGWGMAVRNMISPNEIVSVVNLPGNMCPCIQNRQETNLVNNDI